MKSGDEIEYVEALAGLSFQKQGKYDDSSKLPLDIVTTHWGLILNVGASIWTFGNS